MNKLQTNYNGRMPFELDDIRWIQDAIFEGLTGFLSGFGLNSYGNSFILSGLNCIRQLSIDTINYDYTWGNGYVCVNGEILKVNAGTASFPVVYNVYWDLNVSYDAAGLETFEDGGSHDTYEVRTAVLIGSSNPLTKLPWNGRSLLDTILHNFNTDTVRSLIESWHLIGAAGEPAFEAAWSNGNNIFGGTAALTAYKKDWNNIVHLKGDVACNNYQGTIFTLPVGYRPLDTRTFFCLGKKYQSSTEDLIAVSIDDAGLVYCNTMGVEYVNLSNINFSI